MAHTKRRGWDVVAVDRAFTKVARDSSCRPGCTVCGKDRQHKRQEKVARRRAGRAEVLSQLAELDKFQV